jgi:hypothetical protein
MAVWGAGAAQSVQSSGIYVQRDHDLLRHGCRRSTTRAERLQRGQVGHSAERIRLLFLENRLGDVPEHGLSIIVLVGVQQVSACL